MRSNMPRTSSGASRPLATSSCGRFVTLLVRGLTPSRKRSSLSPPRRERVLEAELVEGTRDDEVDEVVDRARLVVEARREEQDHGARLPQPEHVLEVDRRERRLARHEDELTALLDRDGNRAVNEVVHRARSDRSERAIEHGHTTY